MNPLAHSAAIEDTPDDLCFRPDFISAPLEDQLKVARKELARYRAENEHRTRRDRGHGAMHPLTYARGVQARRSLVRNIWLQIQSQQEKPS